MSASTTPTRRPCWARDAARLAVTDDLPTPPLPDATAYTRVSEPARAKGTSRSATPPRSLVFSSPRCSSLMTPSVTVTPVTPSTRGEGRGGVLGEGVLERAGRDGEQDRDGDVAGLVGGDALDHAELGDRLADLGVDDRLERSVQGVGADLGHGPSLGRRWCRSRRVPSSASGARAHARGPRSSISSRRSRSSLRTKSRVACVAQRDAQCGHLAGEELGVGEVALVAASGPARGRTGRGRPGGSARAGSAERRTTPAG